MSLTIYEGNNADDRLCGIIMSSAIANPNIPRSLMRLDPLGKGSLLVPLGNSIRLIALHEGTAAGFIDYSAAKHHIKYFFVKPQFQGRGIGMALLDAVHTRLEHSITVNVLCSNENAILWYLDRGFRVMSLWKEQFNGEKTAWLKLSRNLK